MGNKKQDELENAIGSNMGCYYRESDGKWLMEVFDAVTKKYIGVRDKTADVRGVVAYVRSRDKRIKQEAKHELLWEELTLQRYSTYAKIDRKHYDELLAKYSPELSAEERSRGFSS